MSDTAPARVVTAIDKITTPDGRTYVALGSLLQFLEPAHAAAFKAHIDSGDSDTADLLASILGTQQRRGPVTISSGVSTVTVTFDTPFADENWSFVGAPSVENSTDGSPLVLFAGTITSRSENGFTVLLNGDTDSANYQLHFLCVR